MGLSNFRKPGGSNFKTTIGQRSEPAITGRRVGPAHGRVRQKPGVVVETDHHIGQLKLRRVGVMGREKKYPLDSNIAEPIP